VSGPLKITTNNPETNIDADLLLKCIGIRINNGAYQSSLSDKMDEKSQLKVNEYFQVDELENVFAIGDCCNSKEIKEAYVAGLHAGETRTRLESLFMSLSVGSLKRQISVSQISEQFSNKVPYWREMKFF
jgi:pyruvate/2-oxoglutarate dehydrogenase complex dihydrolipoamide dehydrogenase (E3) component